MSDDQAREMRPETTSEHIARDMREGRFPEQSERQMVPVLASLPHEIQVWRSMDALDHTGTWSTTRYPAEAVTYVSKADAQAAVALMVAQAATQADPWDGPVTKNKIVDAQAIAAQQIKARIRALAPADGLAAVEALRVEARENAMQALASMGQAQEAYEAQLEAEAELARVKADAAAAQALMVERAAEVCDDLAIGYAKHKGVPGALHDAARDIRALALDAGTAELAKLREQADGMVKRLARRIRNQRVRLRQMEGFKCRCCDLMAMRLQRLKRSNAYRADCDRLAAELAAAQQREAELLAALEDPLVVHLNMVAGKIAKPLPSQLAHIYGEDVIRAALAQTPTDPGDGWTWNERLGWIGPDGKPADPRRRG